MPMTTKQDIEPSRSLRLSRDVVPMIGAVTPTGIAQPGCHKQVKQSAYPLGS